MKRMSGPDTDSTVKAVSLFSGLGGLDIGLHQLGIETVACVEKNPAAAATLRINSTKHDAVPEEECIGVPERYPWVVVDRNIRNIDAEDILEQAGCDSTEIDLVVGGPPCQTFSRSNEGSRSGTDAKRGRLYEEFARILHEIRPTAFIFENVRGLKSANGGADLETIQTALEGGRYTSDYKVLNAADHGVPQTRKRIFIIGTRHDDPPSFPEPTHTEDGRSGTREWVNTGEALSEFEIDTAIEEAGGYTNAIGSRYGPLLKDIPEGANYQHFSQRKYDPEAEEYVERDKSELDAKRFDWRSRHWNYLLKIDRRRPCWTIQADPGTTVGPFHWRARKLSLMEQMKLMDLPLDYYVAGTPGQVQQQIGNAVPPGLAAAVTRELLSFLGLAQDSATCTEHISQPTAQDVDEQVPFIIEVDTDTSPWSHAGRILRAVLAEEAAVVTARQQAIPYAIDALEIAKRQTQVELTIDIEETVTTDEEAKGEVVSTVEATVVTPKAATRLSRSARPPSPET